MKIYKITYLIGFVTALLMTGCTKEEVVVNESQKGIIDDPTGTPVLFSVGNVNPTTTRADIPYMAEGGRFVCTMYYHSASTATAQNEGDFDIKHPDDHGTLSNAWLQVNNNVGNSVYRKNTFETPTTLDDNGFNFDKDATIFYWQNRLTHAFLAFADYNKLKTNKGVLSSTASENIGKLKMYPDYDKDLVINYGENATEEQIAAYNNTLLDNRYVNSYNLKRGTFSKMQDQPDPILALTKMKPGGATQEANRVRLYFKHQFSQIQVNIKDAEDNSASITADQIDQVALLGVSDSAYVHCRLNKGGTVGASYAKEVHQDSFTEEELAVNEWGTSFLMFDMKDGDANGDGKADGTDAYASGYLKSFNAIAFGNLQAIRITWHESEHHEKVHVTTYRVPKTNETTTDNNSSTSDKEVVQLRQLQSGMKYIYNLELRRGTLAVIRTEIVDWDQHENLVYDTNGTIQTSANQ